LGQGFGATGLQIKWGQSLGYSPMSALPKGVFAVSFRAWMMH